MLERKCWLRKHDILTEIQTVNPSFNIDVNKLVVMPIDVLLRKKNRELLTAKMNKEARRIQRWFREKTADKRRGFKIGIWELKNMM